MEADFPELAVGFEPLVGVSEGLGFEPARAALGVFATGDEAGVLEDFEVFGDCRLSHGEGLGEFVDRGFAEGQAGEDGAPGRVSEGGEGGIEGGGVWLHITVLFNNQLIIYVRMERVKRFLVRRVDLRLPR